jgi:hypothetical protein
VRRFGWSNESPEAARAHAEARAAEALGAILSGEKRPRREPKVPYNGAEGVPIREEIVGEHGNIVITRNSYGALCLNTPDVLFADLDLEETCPRPAQWAGTAVLFWWLAGTGEDGARSVPRLVFLGLVALASGFYLVSWGHFAWVRVTGGRRRRAMRRLHRFLRCHPEWRVRVYATPAGYRLMAVHRLFNPLEPGVESFFRAVRADRRYGRMCRRQGCFRARLTAKPWRIGLKDRLRPRPGTWPVRPESMPARRSWLETYDARAAGYAACRFEAELGTGNVDPATDAVRDLHDAWSRALGNQELA